MNPRKILPFWEVGIFQSKDKEILLPHWKFWRHNCKLKMQEVHNSSRSSWKSFWEPTTKIFVSYCKSIGFNNNSIISSFSLSILSDFCIMTEQGTILWMTFTFWQEARTRKVISEIAIFPVTQGYGLHQFESDIYQFTTYSYLIEWLDSSSSW